MKELWTNAPSRYQYMRQSLNEKYFGFVCHDTALALFVVGNVNALGITLFNTLKQVFGSSVIWSTNFVYTWHRF